MKGVKVILIVSLIFLLVPFSFADIAEDMVAIQGKVQDFIAGEEFIVVEGRYASTVEKQSFAFIQDQYPGFQAETVQEEDLNINQIGNKTLILIGGPSQNLISKEILTVESFTSEKEQLGVGSIEFLQGPARKVMIFSDKAGYENEPKKVSKSPLAKVIPVEFVPVAATGIGLGLVWLWKILGEWAYRIFRFKIADKIMGKAKKKQLKKEFKGVQIAGIRIKIREWISIAVSAVVFGASLGYIYLEPNASAFTIVALTIVANMVMYTIRHLVRLIMDKRFGAHTEFHIWWFGAFITVVSGWLGNAFCVAGYIVSDETKKEEAKIAYIINLFAFFLFLVFFAWNFISPGLIIQMVMILTVSYTLLQMLPMKPFPGKQIFAWSKKLWWVTFLPLAIFYVCITMIV